MSESGQDEAMDTALVTKPQATAEELQQIKDLIAKGLLPASSLTADVEEEVKDDDLYDNVKVNRSFGTRVTSDKEWEFFKDVKERPHMTGKDFENSGLASLCFLDNEKTPYNKIPTIDAELLKGKHIKKDALAEDKKLATIQRGIMTAAQGLLTYYYGGVEMQRNKEDKMVVDVANFKNDMLQLSCVALTQFNKMSEFRVQSLKERGFYKDVKKVVITTYYIVFYCTGSSLITISNLLTCIKYR